VTLPAKKDALLQIAEEEHKEGIAHKQQSDQEESKK
jgi:hypothetical protein